MTITKEVRAMLDMRVVEYCENSVQVTIEDAKTEDIKKGWFHCWNHLTDEDGISGVNAIIERLDGIIIGWWMTCFRFVSTPTNGHYLDHFKKGGV